MSNLTAMIPHAVQFDSTRLLPLYSGTLDSEGLELAITLRKKLCGLLDQYYALVPAGVTIADAIHERLISEELVVELYNTLRAYINDEPINSRLLLYLPFELIPYKNDEMSAKFVKPIQSFLETLKRAWVTLLNTVEIRANYINGDHEIGSANDLVCKAAHWTLVLIERGYLSKDDLYHMTLNSNDEVVRRSLRDAISASNGVGFFSYSSHKSAVTEVISPNDLWICLETAYLAYIHDHKLVECSDTARNVWIKRQYSESLILAVSHKADSFSVESLVNFLLIIDEFVMSEVVCGAIRSLRNRMHSNEHERWAILNRLLHLCGVLMQTADELIIDECHVTTNHINYYASNDSAMKLLCERADFHQSQEAITIIDKVRCLLDCLLENESLNDNVVPVVIVTGSRIKGFERNDSDFDFSLVLRPCDEQVFRSAEQFIVEKCGDLGIQNITLFRTEDNSSYWSILEYSGHSSMPGSITMANVLFSGLWVGDLDSIREAQEKLSCNYSLEHSSTIRYECLRQLEVSSVVYRLMHTGYDRIFPRLGGISGQFVNMVDGSSVFWDTGYRRLSTRLFVSNVWMP